MCFFFLLTRYYFEKSITFASNPKFARNYARGPAIVVPYKYINCTVDKKTGTGIGHTTLIAHTISILITKA